MLLPTSTVWMPNKRVDSPSVHISTKKKNHGHIYINIKGCRVTNLFGWESRRGKGIQDSDGTKTKGQKCFANDTFICSTPFWITETRQDLSKSPLTQWVGVVAIVELRLCQNHRSFKLMAFN